MEKVLKGRYEIREEIHRGAQGRVFRAFDNETDRDVVVKEMSDRAVTALEREKIYKRFKNEGKLLSKLDHRGIPKLIDSFEEEESSYIVIPFIIGRNLDEIMKEKEGKPLSSEVIKEVADGVLEILDYLHKLKPPVIFRDIKPSNLMIDDENKVHLIDFGIAREKIDGKKNDAIGTPGYAPPEQYKGECSPPGDLYSLGATLHFMATAFDPQSKEHPPFIFEDVHNYNEEIPETLRRLIWQCLMFKTKNRPKSAEELIKALKGETELPEVREEEIEVEPILPDVQKTGAFWDTALFYVVIIIILGLTTFGAWMTGLIKLPW